MMPFVVPHLVLLSGFVAMMLVGVFAVLLPFVPNLSFMLLLALVFGVIDGFTHLTLINLGILSLIFLLALVVDYSAGVLGAKYGGAQTRSILYGLVGLLIGLLLLPPLGAPIGLFAGIVIGELRARKTLSQAARAGTAGLIGSTLGLVFNFCLALVFLILFIVFALH